MARYDTIRNGTGTQATPGVYDIVKEYDWTSVPRTSDLRNEAPSAYITAYELKYSQLRSFVDGYMNILSPQNNSGSYANSKNPGLDFYKGLYTVKDGPIARLNFPFFEDSFRSFSTEFADTFSPISQRGAQMFGGQAIQGLGGAAESLAGGGLAAVNALASFGDTGNGGDQTLADKVAKTASGVATGVAKTLGLNPGRQTIGTPGSYIETPKFYQYSNTDNGLQIGFTLSNTLEDDSIDKNFKFICDFTKMNRPYRYGPIGMDFPAIYNLVVPGLRYIQWAFLENFEVSMLGNRRKIGSRVIPEAYVCNFTFRSLTVEPANFMEELCENRDAFGDFDSYSANQAKQELSFQKGKYERERTLNKRSKLAKAIREGDNLPNQNQPPTPQPGPLPQPGPPRPRPLEQIEVPTQYDIEGQPRPQPQVFQNPNNGNVIIIDSNDSFIAADGTLTEAGSQIAYNYAPSTPPPTGGSLTLDPNAPSLRFVTENEFKDQFPSEAKEIFPFGTKSELREGARKIQEMAESAKPKSTGGSGRNTNPYIPNTGTGGLFGKPKF